MASYFPPNENSYIQPLSGILVLSDDERRWLIFALDAAVDQPPKDHRAAVEAWRELRKALAL